MEKYSSDEELVVNGNFDSTDFKGWTVTGADGGVSPYINNGIAILPNLTSISQTINITGGKTYSLSYDMGILYQGAGYISVVSTPSNTTLFNDTSAGDQTAISLTVTNTSDTSLTITFDCTRGGEVDVDNVSLLESESAFVIGGDFSDPSLPGWVKYGTSTMPYAADGHLKLPAGAYVTQDITLDEVTDLTLNYIMTIPEGTAGSFTVSSLPSSTEIYTNSTGSAGENITLTLAENDIGIRLKFSCKSGAEVDVDNVAVKHKSLVQDVTITEVLDEEGKVPVLDIASASDISFTLDTKNLPDGTGAYIKFEAPKGTIINNISFPDISDPEQWELNIDSEGKNARATLTGDKIYWGSSFIVNVSFDNTMDVFSEITDGTISYYNSDPEYVNSGAFDFYVASNNPWDNIAGVSDCLIAMGVSDGNYQLNGTVFVNGSDNSESGFTAHSIPLFVGVNFILKDAAYPIPSSAQVQEAFSLVNDLGADVSEYITNASDTTYLQPYSTNIDSTPNKLKSQVYQVELDSFAVWCPLYHTDPLPTPIQLCIKLSAKLTFGTYEFISNATVERKLPITFIAQKKYTYSDTPGSGDYILINSEDAGDNITINSDRSLVGYGSIPARKIFLISIDSTPEYSKYVFKFVTQVGMSFEKAPIAPEYEIYGEEIDSTFISGMAIKNHTRWRNYVQFMVLPKSSETGQIDISANRGPTVDILGYLGTHGDYGWSPAGYLIGTYTVPANNIAFYGLSADNYDASKDVIFNVNNDLVDGHARVHLIDNYGNNIYIQLTFSGEDGGDFVYLKLAVNDQ